MLNQQYCSPLHQPNLRFKNFIFSFFGVIKTAKQPPSHQVLCRAVRIALGMGPDSNNYPTEFCFDTSAPKTAVFIEKLKASLKELKGYNYSFNFLAFSLAKALGYVDYSTLLLTLHCYQNFKTGIWIFDDDKISYPFGFDPQTFLNKRSFMFYMPDSLNYGSSSQVYSVGDTYCVFKDESTGGYYPLSFTSRSIRMSAKRSWGITPIDAVLWLIANRVVEYGSKAWNQYVNAADDRLYMERSRDKYYKAVFMAEKWMSSDLLLELKIKTIKTYSRIESIT